MSLPNRLEDRETLQTRIKSLRDGYVASLPQELQEALAVRAADNHAALLELAHRQCGTAGSLGLTALSAAARDAQRALRTHGPAALASEAVLSWLAALHQICQDPPS